jgi:hypothetical protein
MLRGDVVQKHDWDRLAVAALLSVDGGVFTILTRKILQISEYAAG